MYHRGEKFELKYAFPCWCFFPAILLFTCAEKKHTSWRTKKTEQFSVDFLVGNFVSITKMSKLENVCTFEESKSDLGKDSALIL